MTAIVTEMNRLPQHLVTAIEDWRSAKQNFMATANARFDELEVGEEAEIFHGMEIKRITKVTPSRARKGWARNGLIIIRHNTPVRRLH